MRFLPDKNSLQTRVSLTLFGLLLLMTLITSTLFIISHKKNLELLHKAYSEILYIYSTRVEQELDTIESFAIEIVTDPVIQESLIQIDSTSTDLDFINISEKIDERLSNLTNHMGLEKVIIIDARNRIASSRRDYPDVERLIKGGFPEHLVNIGKNEEWILTSSQVSSASYIRAVKKAEGLDLTPLGLVYMEINKKNVWRNINQYFPHQNLKLQIRYNKRTIFSNMSIGELNTIDVGNRSGDYDVYSFESQKFFMTHYYSPERGLNYILSVPYKSYFKDFQLYSILVFLIQGILFILVIPASILFSRNFTTPIIELSEQMRQVESDDFRSNLSNLIISERKDEIGILYSEFGAMLRKIDVLVNENLKKQILIKDTQFRHLQAQINPHFLYNTLESVNWMARLKDQNEIAIMVESLGKLFRSSINKNITITLKEELDLLKSYVRIQKQRFKERLEVNYDIDEESLSFIVPKFILQPLVENSIKYGLEKLQRKCSIAISSDFTEEETLQICVMDDGPGMSEERRIEILENRLESKSTGIGIQNIRERLDSIYGGNTEFSIITGENRGTIICIGLPTEVSEERGE